MEAFPRELRTIEDLIALLEAEPVWVERLRAILFTRELLALPERISRIEEFLQRQAEWNAQVSALLTRYDEHLKEQSERIKEHSERIKEHSERIKEHSERIKEHSERIARLEELMAQHSERIARLERLIEENSERIARLEELIAQQAERLDRHEKRINKLTDDVAFLKGMVLEIRTTLRVPAIFGRMIRKARQADLNAIFDQAYALYDAGQLSATEIEDLLNMDLVVEGNLRTDGQQPILLAVEVSFCIDANDVERAARRAALLSRVTGQQAQGVVVGTQLTAEGKEAAQTHNVTWILQVLPRGD